MKLITETVYDGASRENRPNNLPVNVGKAHIAATEPKSQPGMIQAEQVKHCRM